MTNMNNDLNKLKNEIRKWKDDLSYNILEGKIILLFGAIILSILFYLKFQ